MAAWSLPEQSLRLLTVAMLFGLRWQPNGSVGSVGIVATWSLHVWGASLLKVAIQSGLQ